VNLENNVDVSELAVIHPSVKIWPGTSVRENVIIGEGTVIGRIGKAGFRLIYKSDKLWICPKTGALYTINESN
jgi:acyl-[acyl carrier protein]--UDP-N-acetylglucosamine O-acyltransferase